MGSTHRDTHQPTGDPILDIDRADGSTVRSSLRLRPEGQNLYGD